MKNVIALLGAASLFAGCHSAPPPAPPPPPVAVAPAPPPPPPPPPKCEATSEGCKGPATARIRNSGFHIAVPDGWGYAQQEDATLVTRDEAVMAITTFGGWPDARTSDANREHAFDTLVSLLGVTSPKHRVVWARPSQKRKAGAIELSLWQADNVSKAAKKGPVLVFGAELPDHTWVLGAGFVPDDDKSDADKTIVGAIESIAASPPPPPPASP
jgi:hypothetical protein